MTAGLNRGEKYIWLSYSYRYNNQASADKFSKWLIMRDWTVVLTAQGSEAKTKIYQKAIEAAIEDFFPLRTTWGRK